MTHKQIAQNVADTRRRFPELKRFKTSNKVIATEIHTQIGDAPSDSHLDHIFPVLAYKYFFDQNKLTDVQLYTIFHPENYCWLSGTENISKGSKVYGEKIPGWEICRLKTARSKWIEPNIAFPNGGWTNTKAYLLPTEQYFFETLSSRIAWTESFILF